MNELLIIQFLRSFFTIYRANIVELRILTDKVQGKIEYAGEETQDFVWYYSNLNQIPKAIQLLDVIQGNKWLYNDKVIISKRHMIKCLEYMGWNDDDIKATIFFLFSLRIAMLDEGEETDSFFIHF